MSAANSQVAAMVAAVPQPMPPSFNGDGQLFAINMFLSLAFLCFALAVLTRNVWALWISRRRDRARHPVAPTGSCRRAPPWPTRLHGETRRCLTVADRV